MLFVYIYFICLHILQVYIVSGYTMWIYDLPIGKSYTIIGKSYR